jgi:hypothetical protein
MKVRIAEIRSTVPGEVVRLINDGGVLRTQRITAGGYVSRGFTITVDRSSAEGFVKAAHRAGKVYAGLPPLPAPAAPKRVPVQTHQRPLWVPPVVLDKRPSGAMLERLAAVLRAVPHDA